jgi:signal transduction histidine kinase
VRYFQRSVPQLLRAATQGGDEDFWNCAIVYCAGLFDYLSIRDNGIGIPPENMQKIFDPFFASKDVGKGKGMGLGLSITYQILQAHKAIIDVDSRLAEFTRFRIVFPGVGFSPSDSPDYVLDPPA